MSESVIVSTDQVTVDWLSGVLSECEALTSGAVRSFGLVKGQGNWSTSATLILQYEAGSSGPMPPRLFLKMVDTDLGDDEFFDDSEVTYYTRDYVDVANAPLLRCYDSAYSPSLHRYHLLLDDVSLSHAEAAEREPTLDYSFALAEGLASIHARWWGQEKLRKRAAPIHNAEHILRFAEIAEPGSRHIVDRFSDHLSPHWPDLMGELFAQHPQAMVKRSKNLEGFTLIHGDVGAANILVHKDHVRPIFIIDRQPFDWSLTTWLGVYDLAYAMVLDWEVTTRRQLEIPVLERYIATLSEFGVDDYRWGDLYDDYRLCVAVCVYVATEYCRGGINERWVHAWLPMLQRSLTAVDDHNCKELWA